MSSINTQSSEISNFEIEYKNSIKYQFSLNASPKSRYKGTQITIRRTDWAKTEGQAWIHFSTYILDREIKFTERFCKEIDREEKAFFEAQCRKLILDNNTLIDKKEKSDENQDCITPNGYEDFSHQCITTYSPNTNVCLLL